MALDLNLLRVFDALMQEREVVAAAHRLGLSAPAVSNALARLRSGTDLLVTVPQRLAEQVAQPPGLVVRELPLALPAFEVNLFWHQCVQADPGHRWLRELWAGLFGEARAR